MELLGFHEWNYWERLGCHDWNDSDSMDGNEWLSWMETAEIEKQKTRLKKGKKKS